MTKFAFALMMTAFVSTASMAQVSPGPQGLPGPVASIQTIEGLATVNEGSTLISAFKGERILNGARIVTSANGSTVITMDNRCVISLSPNQAVTINTSLDCRTLVAGVQTTVVATSSPGASGLVGSNPVGLAALVGGLIGVGLNMREPGRASGS